MAAGFGDATGRLKDELTELHKTEQAAKAKNMAMITAELEAEAIDEPVELETNESKEAKAAIERAERDAVEGELFVQDVDETERVVEFKVNVDLEDVTVGYGNTYSFERGRTYKAPYSVYWHLESKGAVWH